MTIMRKITLIMCALVAMTAMAASNDDIRLWSDGPLTWSDFHQLMGEQIITDCFADCHVFSTFPFIIFEYVFIHGKASLHEFVDLLGNLDSHLSLWRIFFPDRPLGIDEGFDHTLPHIQMRFAD